MLSLCIALVLLAAVTSAWPTSDLDSVREDGNSSRITSFRQPQASNGTSQGHFEDFTGSSAPHQPPNILNFTIADTLFTFTIDPCLYNNLSVPIGIWEDFDGTVITNATVGEIQEDSFGARTSYGNYDAALEAGIKQNCLNTVSIINNFYNTFVCNDSDTASDNNTFAGETGATLDTQLRHLLANEVQIVTINQKKFFFYTLVGASTAGLVSYGFDSWANPNYTNRQYAVAAIIPAMLVLTGALLAWLQQQSLRTRAQRLTASISSASIQNLAQTTVGTSGTVWEKMKQCLTYAFPCAGPGTVTDDGIEMSSQTQGVTGPIEVCASSDSFVSALSDISSLSNAEIGVSPFETVQQQVTFDDGQC